VATGGPPRPTAIATGPQQKAGFAVAATAVVTATMPAPPASAPTAGDCAAVVDIPDDDTPPPGWVQWENRPAPAPEPVAGVLVVRADGCVMPRR
jgi:hypothetical protein